MKTAVSIPDEVFHLAERLAKKQAKSRSQLYADALAEYLARREPAKVTSAINETLETLGDEADRDFASQAARKTLGDAEW